MKVKKVESFFYSLLFAFFSSPSFSSSISTLPCSESSNCSLGIYGQSPESPDEKKVMYVEIDDENKSGKVVIVNKSDKTRILEVPLNRVDPHNGARQYWESDRLIVFQDGYQDVIIYDVIARRRIEALSGKVGLLNPHGNVLIKKDWNNKKKEVPGIYEYNINERTSYLIISYGNIEKKICKAQEECFLEDIWNIKSLENERYFFRADFEKKGKKLKYLVHLKKNGEIFKTKLPIHFFLTSDKIYGTINGDFFDFSKLGEIKGKINLIVNHFDIYHDLLATDPNYNSDSVFLKLCSISNENCWKVFENKNSEIVWKNYYHINPAFSENGKRLYFNFPSDENKVVVAFVNL